MTQYEDGHIFNEAILCLENHYKYKNDNYNLYIHFLSMLLGGKELIYFSWGKNRYNHRAMTPNLTYVGLNPPTHIHRILNTYLRISIAIMLYLVYKGNQTNEIGLVKDVTKLIFRRCIMSLFFLWRFNHSYMYVVAACA